jgi:hypothetical protein
MKIKSNIRMNIAYEIYEYCFRYFTSQETKEYLIDKSQDITEIEAPFAINRLEDSIMSPLFPYVRFSSDK